jgi:2-oxoglutarate ferredoxin oxidoreductase subunit beta
MLDELTTYAHNTWCPGCGNFGIFNAFKKAIGKLGEKGIGQERIFMAAGIGQHAKIFDYVSISGFYSLHGRSIATIQGVKLANPDLKVIGFAGDGDAFGEGVAHMIYAAKRNADITMVIHDNGVYALTTGQRSPMSAKGYKGPSTPMGSEEEPLNPLTLMLETGATFVARAYAGNVDHLAEMMVQAILHEGFSFIDVLQPCVTFNDKTQEYNKMVEVLGAPPKSYDEAVALARRKDRLPLGIFYQVQKPSHHRALYGQHNPVKRRLSRKQRIKKLERLILSR